jgi:predicted HTH domain antitoxin
MPTIAKEDLGQEHLLVLYSVNKAPNGVPTKTHYQKMMFLALKALGNDPKTGAGFRPHHFGPYSAMVDSWRDELINTGYLVKNSAERIKVEPLIKNDVGGIKFQDELTMMKIDEVVKFICSLSYDELLLSIYADDVLKGEGMSENSDEKDRIFKERVNIAVGMVKNGKVSIARGAELADVDVMTFMEKLRKVS